MEVTGSKRTKEGPKHEEGEEQVKVGEMGENTCYGNILNPSTHVKSWTWLHVPITPELGVGEKMDSRSLLTSQLAEQ